MISLAPVGALDDEQGSATCCASVSQHRHIEAQVKNAIADVCSEWKRRCNTPSEVLDSSCREARNLVVAIDRFMSNGCLRGNRLYWYFAKEFLTRSECESLMDEWRALNERDLSVAWLKDSLNKQSMSFVFQSFVLNWKLVLKHYSREAAIANRALTKRLANNFLEISDVRFYFSAPSDSASGVPVAEMRTSVVFAESERPRSPQSTIPQETNHLMSGGSGICETPASTTVVRSRLSRRRRSARSESSSRAISDVPLPPDFVETPPLMTTSPYISSAKDYDYVFDQMLHRGERGLVACGSLPLLRVSRTAPSSHQRSVETPPACGSFPECHNGSVPDGRRASESLATYYEEQPLTMGKVPNPFDVALKMSLSKAKLLAAARETEAKPPSPVPTPPVEFTPFGEMRLDMGEVVGLSIKVFRDEMEKFLKFYQVHVDRAEVYVHFGTGQPDHRFFVLSNRAVYLLSLQCNLVSARKTYITCAYLPLKNIDFIAVGADYEVLYLHVVKGGCLETEDGTRLDSNVLEVCTACTQLGHAMVDAISNAYKQCVASTLPICTDSTPQQIISTKFLAKELHLENPKLECYCLAQWRQTRADCAMGDNVAQRSGFLYYKLVKTNSWLPHSGDYRQSFFHLQGKKLYQFEDSTCKVGERVIAIQETVSSVLELKGREQSPHMFQMELNNGEKYEFICQSGSDLHKWVSLLNFALSTTDLDDEAVACIAMVSSGVILIAQEGVKCALDGFMRLLTRIDLQRVQSAVGVLASERYACVLNDGQNLDWIFLRSPDQIDRFLATIQRLGVNRVSNEEDGSSRLTALLNSMPRSGDLFYFSDAHSDDAFEL